MAITTECHLGRLRAMTAPGQQTWDLSDNDVAAIKAVLRLIDDVLPKCRDALAMVDAKYCFCKQAGVCGHCKVQAALAALPD